MRKLLLVFLLSNLSSEAIIKKITLPGGQKLILDNRSDSYCFMYTQNKQLAFIIEYEYETIKIRYYQLRNKTYEIFTMNHENRIINLNLIVENNGKFMVCAVEDYSPHATMNTPKMERSYHTMDEDAFNIMSTCITSFSC